MRISSPARTVTGESMGRHGRAYVPGLPGGSTEADVQRSSTVGVVTECPEVSPAMVQNIGIGVSADAVPAPANDSTPNAATRTETRALRMTKRPPSN